MGYGNYRKENALLLSKIVISSAEMEIIMNLLEMKHVKKTFDNLEVLKDISIEVKEGEVVAIIGPSGSGKSTFLRCATLLETMDEGTLAYCGESATLNTSGATEYVDKNTLHHLKNDFGLVFQNFNLFPHFSVLKNVIDAPVNVQKRNKDEVIAEARELLSKVGLENKEDNYPGQLSGGQQQRVAIARALAMHPKMLFFDEPTSALDPEITAGILKLLRALADEKMTMVIVTHEIAFARNVADRVIFMDGGVIVEEGKPEDVIDNPKSERTKAFLQKMA
jgi:polar amino acid transport system ATP-binding protein